jgi:two-component system, NarL family, nitrate/nitrite response regulator NarL
VTGTSLLRHSVGARPLSDSAAPAQTIRVLVGGTVRLYREGVAELLARFEDIEVVDSTGGNAQTVAAAIELEPDVALLDPGAVGGASAIRDLTGALPATKVIVLASSDTEDEVIEYAEAGMAGLVDYQDSAEDLAEVIRSVARGELRCSPRTAAALLRRVTALAAVGTPAESDPPLTPREQDVLDLMAEGLSNKQMASQLHIELATVKHHVHHILEKLGASRRGEAVAHARRSGLLHGP